METTIFKLKSKARDNPDNLLLLQAIAHLSDLQHSRTAESKNHVSWDVLRQDFHLLEAEGLWERTEENTKLLNDIRTSMSSLHDMDGSMPEVAKASGIEHSSSKTYPDSGKISVVVPPLVSPTFPSIDASVLPLELANMLNHAYLLHVLATDPTKMLPPGKSLLSVLSRPPSENTLVDGSVPTLHKKVEDMVHKAFWDEVRAFLSNHLTKLNKINRL